MSLLLAIETSSDQRQVVLGQDGDSVFDSAQDIACVSSKTLAGLVSCGLTSVSAQATDIIGVAVNIGPGGLTYIRAGVSLVNALAYSLGISVFPFNWFEIVAHQARKLTRLPILCAVPAANNQAYLALINGTSIENLRFGPLSSSVAEISKGLPQVAVAGRIRHQLASLLNREVFDTGIEKPDAKVLLELGFRARQLTGTGTTQVSPLNDQSEIFYEWTSATH